MGPEKGSRATLIQRNAARMSMKFTIIDQSLQDYDGHHFEYDLAVAEAARDLKLDTLVLANRVFEPQRAPGINVVPWFSRGSYGAGRSWAARLALGIAERLPKAPRELVLKMLRCLRDWLKKGTRRGSGSGTWLGTPFGSQAVQALAVHGLVGRDHVLVHSFMLSELRALSVAMRTLTEPPHLHLVLRRDPGEPEMRGEEDQGILGTLRALRALPFFKSHIHLYADTEPLARAYAALTEGARVDVVPIPHCLPDVPERAAAEGPAQLVYLGNARSEKGFQHLPDMVAYNREVLFATGKARLIAQSNSPMGLDAGLMAPVLRRLRAMPDHVDLIDRPLSVAEFQDLLFSADLVLLPYDATAYRKRSSGILIQAAVAGKPVVVPEDSWLADEAVPGAHVTFGESRSFGEAVRLAVTDLARLSDAARAQQARVRDIHNATRLVRMMLERGEA